MIVRINGNAYELAEKAELKTEFLALMFPVGYVMILATNIDPNKTIGGTWQKIKSGKFLEATEDAGQLKVEVQPGLPNITGDTGGGIIEEGSPHPSGCFWTDWSLRHGHNYGLDHPIFMDASRCNPIYGRSSTVQPSSIKVAMWIRVA